VFIYSRLCGIWSLWACNLVSKHDAVLVFNISWCANGVWCCCIWDPFTFQLNVSGLTLLLPYIICTRRNWSACKLRVFALANKKDELEFEQRKYVLGFYCFCFNVGTELSLLSLKSDYHFLVSTCKFTSGFMSWQWHRFFLSSHYPHWLWVASALYLSGKQLGPETDHLHPVLRTRIHGAALLTFPHMFSWHDS
jgi:hypothetical protein